MDKGKRLELGRIKLVDGLQGAVGLATGVGLCLLKWRRLYLFMCL